MPNEALEPFMREPFTVGGLVSLASWVLAWDGASSSSTSSIVAVACLGLPKPFTREEGGAVGTSSGSADNRADLLTGCTEAGVGVVKVADGGGRDRFAP